MSKKYRVRKRGKTWCAAWKVTSYPLAICPIRFKIRPNNDTGSNYLYSYVATNNASLSTEYNNGATYGFFAVTPITSNLKYRVNATGLIPRYTSTETKIIQSTGALDLAGASTRIYTGQTNHDLNTAITSITFVHDTISSGTLYLYGVN